MSLDLTAYDIFLAAVVAISGIALCYISIRRARDGSKCCSTLKRPGKLPITVVAAEFVICLVLIIVTFAMFFLVLNQLRAGRFLPSCLGMIVAMAFSFVSVLKMMNLVHYLRGRSFDPSLFGIDDEL